MRIVRRRPSSVFFVLLFIVAAIYSSSLGVPYHFDDTHTIQNNPSVKALSRIPSFFLSADTFSILPENRSYRPLTSAVFAIAYGMADGATWPFHVLKILMHACSCFFVFLIWRELFSYPGWFPLPPGERPLLSLPGGPMEIGPEEGALALAMIFAIHPANTETVTYISANTHLQASLLYLAAFTLFLFSLRKKACPPWTLIFFALGAYFCASLSKEEAITFPASASLAAFMLSERRHFSSRIKEAWARTWPYWIAFVLIGLLIREMTPASWAKSRGQITPLNYLMTQWRAWLWYLRLWFWPWDLNADNVAFEFTSKWSEPRVIQAVLGNLMLGGFAWWNRKRFPALIFGLLWFLIAVSPSSSVIPLAEPINEHRMYLAYAGFSGGALAFILGLVWGAFKPGPSPRASAALALLLTLGLAIGTLTRIQVWQTSESLWSDTVQKNPGSGRALNNLALVYMGRGDFKEALDLLDRCEASWNRYVYCPINKGIIYMAKKDAPSAEKSLIRALELDPDNIFTNENLGRFYQNLQNDPVRALAFFEKTQRLSGGRSIEAMTHMGEIYLAQGKRQEAFELAQEIRTLDAHRPLAHDFLEKIDQMNADR